VAYTGCRRPPHGSKRQGASRGVPAGRRTGDLDALPDARRRRRHPLGRLVWQPLGSLCQPDREPRRRGLGDAWTGLAGPRRLRPRCRRLFDLGARPIFRRPARSVAGAARRRTRSAVLAPLPGARPGDDLFPDRIDLRRRPVADLAGVGERSGVRPRASCWPRCCWAPSWRSAIPRSP